MRYSQDVLLEKVVENDHELFFPKENVVRQVLNNLSDEKKATSNIRVTGRCRDVNCLWRYDGWTDEAGENPKLILVELPERITIYRKNRKPPTAAYLLSGHCCDLNQISTTFCACSWPPTLVQICERISLDKSYPWISNRSRKT